MQHVFRAQVVLLIVCATVWRSQQQSSFIKEEGSSCNLPNSHRMGVCKILKECPEVQCQRKKRRPVETCGFEWPDLVVCCDTIRISQRECYNYRQRLDKKYKILNGTMAKETEFPHMAAIGSRKTGSIVWKCGGSLISPRYVLTAAHCLTPFRKDFSYLRVRLGALNLTNPGPKSVTLRIRNIIIHEEYNTPASARYHDIGLIELEKNIIFTSHIRPACLFNREVEDETILSATGWGTTTVNGHSTSASDHLLKVNLTESKINDCKSELNSESELNTFIPRGVEQSMICAVDKEGYRETCLGDSGGPLQFKENRASSLYAVVGITSIGLMPCSPGIPSIYTRVSEYLDWIECHVWI